MFWFVLLIFNFKTGFNYYVMGVLLLLAIIIFIYNVLLFVFKLILIYLVILMLFSYFRAFCTLNIWLLGRVAVMTLQTMHEKLFSLNIKNYIAKFYHFFVLLWITIYDCKMDKYVDFSGFAFNYWLLCMCVSLWECLILFNYSINIYFVCESVPLCIFFLSFFYNVWLQQQQNTHIQSVVFICFFF